MAGDDGAAAACWFCSRDPHELVQFFDRRGIPRIKSETRHIVVNLPLPKNDKELAWTISGRLGAALSLLDCFEFQGWNTTHEGGDKFCMKLYY